ncbi:MAG TPA: saccharopine dehydrogenase NADP-binding domain-containing protein [Thermoanaerobaculia bacterium]|nr:saccharopine dehydrogenase NADP-binding domain-containing protein [Thermoanaerobaculia bacterium]
MIAVFGGYGVFGSLVAKELARAGAPVRIAGRDEERAVRFANELGPGNEGIKADASDPASCTRALAGAAVAVSCVGPFGDLSPALPESCLASSVHYVDIADERGWFAGLRQRSGLFRERGLTAACGCSSLPGISGALAVIAAERLHEVRRARVTLFIGNANPKGTAAVESAARQVGRRFQAPQGTLIGFRGREVVELPAPFGLRGVYDFESPELDLFPELVGAGEVRVKVGFESRLATQMLAALSYLGPRLGVRLSRAITPLARLASRFGHSGGQVKVELWDEKGARSEAGIGGPREGQRLAALPAVFVALDFLRGKIAARGTVTAYEALGARPLLERLAAAGYELMLDSPGLSGTAQPRTQRAS